MKNNKHGILAVFALCLAFAPGAWAACSPGVPCVSYSPGNGANDDKTDGSAACDGDFMNQIYARAFLEGQRDMMYAQTYIRKPDSTLEYTCFDRYLNQAARRAPPLFSESTFWSGRSIPLNIAFTDGGNPTSIQTQVNMGSGHIAPNLTNVVSSAMTAFLENFDHSLLGGAVGMNPPVSSSVSPGSYSCGTMSSIWHIAYCQNFARTSLFYTFEELASNDIRALPDSCPENGITTELVEIARNAPTTYPAAEIDPMITQLARMNPAQSTGDCFPPVPTGLVYTYYDVQDVAPTADNPAGANVIERRAPEFICINPGCYYHVDANVSGGSITLSNQSCRRG